jgi:hypothetical protein
MAFVLLALVVSLVLFAYCLCRAAGRTSRQEEWLDALRAELEAVLARRNEREGVLRRLREAQP